MTRRGQLLVGSRNPVKVERWQRALSEFDVVSPAAVGVELNVSEGAESLQENSQVKARAYATASGMTTLAEDTGLFIDALDGLPGIQIKRWGGKYDRELADRELLDELRQALAGCGDASAHFESAVSIATPSGEVVTLSRVVTGRFDAEKLLLEPQAGYPLSRSFVADRSGKTWAEMTWEERCERDRPFIQNVSSLVARMLTL